MNQMDQGDWKDVARLAASKNMDPVASQILDLPPSCIEFVPVAGDKGPLHFIIGTYNLQKDVSQELERSKAQSRNGSLNLFQLEEGKLTLLETMSYPSAIPDLHFCPAQLQNPIFAVASSTGVVSIYDVHSSGESERYAMRHVCTHQILDTDTLILSLTWYPRLETRHLPLLTVTTSKGGVYLVRFTSWDFSAYEVLNEKVAIVQHKLMDDPIEAWCCAFSSPPAEPQIYTGGDDSTLRITGISSLYSAVENTEDMAISRTSQNSRAHGAGVTAILPLPGTTLLVTGSYDEHIRLFSGDLRGEPKAQMKIEGGGVWRLKLLDDGQSKDGVTRYTILASCMHAGARMIELDIRDSGEHSEFRVLATVTIHRSMCYACDIAPLDAVPRSVRPYPKRLIVSTSFYDKLLCVWNYDPEAEVEGESLT